jgi:hypothetical protein
MDESTFWNQLESLVDGRRVDAIGWNDAEDEMTRLALGFDPITWREARIAQGAGDWCDSEGNYLNA